MPPSPEERVLRSLIRHMKNSETDPLTPLIDRYYIERHRSKNRLRDYHIDLAPRPRPHGRFSPSKIAGCERAAAFNFVGMPGNTIIDPEQQGIFDDGDWRHHRWQATFRDMELVLGKKTFNVVSIEESVQYEDLFIAGSLDALVHINGVKWVIDFKGINSWGFERVYRSHEPIPAHVLQLISYMKARRVRRGILLYEHKDKNLTAAFIVHFTNKQWFEVQDWCERVLKQIKRREIPLKSLECQAGTMLYEKCPYSKHCFGRLADDEEKIRRRMYRAFPGIQKAWDEGCEIVAAHERGRSG